MAPSISGLGARSEPIASSAITLGMFDEHDFQLAGFFDFEDVASLVGAALGAGAMRHLLLVAIRALGKRVAFEGIVRAPRRGALLGVSSFWIGHVSKFLSRGRLRLAAEIKVVKN